MANHNAKSGQNSGNRPRGVIGRHRAPYEAGPSPKGNVICEDCGIYHRGNRWLDGVPPLGDEVVGLCPACRRVRDNYPAGTIHVHDAPAELETELRNMMHHCEKAEREGHPLERLMAIESNSEGLHVTTTGVHLARRIANALERRLHRQGHFEYADGDMHLVVEFRSE